MAVLHTPDDVHGPELDASRTVAILLCLLTGGFGFHRIYIGLRSGWPLFGLAASTFPLMLLVVLTGQPLLMLPIGLFGLALVVIPLVDVPRLIVGNLRPADGWTQR